MTMMRYSEGGDKAEREATKQQSAMCLGFDELAGRLPTVSVSFLLPTVTVNRFRVGAIEDEVVPSEKDEEKWNWSGIHLDINKSNNVSRRTAQINQNNLR